MPKTPTAPSTVCAASAALVYGADGLCIEAHVELSKGIGDDPKQALTPEALKKTITRAR